VKEEEPPGGALGYRAGGQKVTYMVTPKSGCTVSNAGCFLLAATHGASALSSVQWTG
jgi:hypothetical protein